MITVMVVFVLAIQIVLCFAFKLYMFIGFPRFSFFTCYVIICLLTFVSNCFAALGVINFVAFQLPLGCQVMLMSSC